jgi:hypothetical protein
MGKSQARGQTIISMIAGDSITAGMVVGFLSTSVANTVYIPDTTTAFIVGVAAESVDSGAAIPVIIAGTAKCIAVNSISTGTLVMPDSATGYVEVFAGTQTTQPVVGIAMENASDGAKVEVLLQIRNVIAG